MSAGMEPEEILSWYDLEYGQLSDYDRWFFDVTFRRGRLEAKKQAVSQLFANMQSPNKGMEASLAFLQRFGNERWQADKSTSQGKIKGLKIFVTDEEGNDL